MASYYLAAVLAHGRDNADTSARLLAGCLPVLEEAGELHVAALGWCLLGRHASVDQRHAAAIKLARHAIELSATGPCSGLERCAALAVLGLTLARIGACGAAVRHCQQAREDARSMHEPIYEAHATQALAQVLILKGDYNQAAALCVEGINLARRYGSDVDAARFGLVLCRARQGTADTEAAIPILRTAVDVFSDAGLILDEITARGLLATSCNSAGDQAAAASQAERITNLMARSGMTDAEQRAAQVQLACDMADRELWPARSRPLIAS
jgi:tetratricopeptide (TPR) repeat protein